MFISTTRKTSSYIRNNAWIISLTFIPSSSSSETFYKNFWSKDVLKSLLKTVRSSTNYSNNSLRIFKKVIKNSSQCWLKQTKQWNSSSKLLIQWNPRILKESLWTPSLFWIKRIFTLSLIRFWRKNKKILFWPKWK